ncbi:hypothetical protein A6V39_03730 [Candidatus Mycoplasma haematobovis]|uniref:Uncharacterized protein n=1 Tax=Candidatus Mycoplasma haematobovis TaxID=432608 RepID=A0A1A9QC03_9MOLU|nr:hypothetical protein [Candidatus Mycoplasma haematobovis]OAL09997.1 hypothetical protein A6V39_03730 [Candidatus Mycoplasma haematobovis]
MNIKLAIASAVSLGTIGGAVGVGYNLFQPKNLRQLLEKKGIKLLDTEKDTNNTQWTELVNKHNGDKQGRTKNNIEIEKLEITETSSIIDSSALKTKCKELFDTPITNDEGFKKLEKDAINWCSEKSPLLEATTSPSVVQPQNPRTSTGAPAISSGDAISSDPARRDGSASLGGVPGA